MQERFEMHQEGPQVRRREPDAVTVKRVKQLSGDVDESRAPRERSARLPLSRLWLPLHRYFDW